jgi:type IV secretion system pilin
MEKLHNKLLAFKLEGQGIPVTTTENSITQLEKIISSVIGIMTVFGAIFFTINIILAGFSLMSSRGDSEKTKSGKKRLTDGVIGLAIIVLAYGLGALITNLLGINNVFDLTKVLTR